MRGAAAVFAGAGLGATALRVMAFGATALRAAGALAAVLRAGGRGAACVAVPPARGVLRAGALPASGAAALAPGFEPTAFFAGAFFAAAFFEGALFEGAFFAVAVFAAALPAAVLRDAAAGAGASSEALGRPRGATSVRFRCTGLPPQISSRW